MVVLQKSEAEIFYFPVHLTQLAPSDPNHIQADPTLFDRLRTISTDLVISTKDEQTLKEAAEAILNADQKDNGWPVGRRCGRSKPEDINQLGDAFAWALLRSQKNWNEPLKFECSEESRRAIGKLTQSARRARDEGKPSVPDSNTRARLEELNNLYSHKLVTVEEYQLKRREILRMDSQSRRARLEALNDLVNAAAIPGRP